MLHFFCQMGYLRWGNPNPNTDSYTVPVPGYGSIWTCTQTSQKLPNLNHILLHQFFFFYPLLEISKIWMPKVFLKFGESKPRGLTVRGLRVRGRMVRGTNCPGLSGRVRTVRVRSVRPPIFPEFLLGNFQVHPSTQTELVKVREYND